MDSYSGRFPLDFISFCLGMATEQQTENSELATADPSVPFQGLPERHAGSPQENRPTDLDALPGIRPLSNLSSSSGNTEESLSTFAEQTLHHLAQMDPSLDVTFLSTAGKSFSQRKARSHPPKVSDSEGLSTPQSGTEQANVGQQKETDLFDLSTFDIGEEQKKSSFETDTSEVGSVYDSAGVDGLTDRPTSSIVGLDPQTASRRSPEPECSNTNSEQGASSQKGPPLPAELSANGRIMLRKHFAQSALIDLPRGHTTVAFTEPQIHAVLKTISDETVKSSLHAMRSLVLHAVHGGKGHTTGQLRKALIRGNLPARATSASSEGESDSEGYTTAGYTSGAYGTDEDIAGTTLDQEVDFDASTPATQTLPIRREDVTSQSGDITIPSPGYSEGDYEPLCQMCPQTKRPHSETSPPQKRRKLQPRPGKVMKSSYFKGIQWTKVFVTGPLDPVHNKHKFYCQICKTNVSIYSKGAREIIRHYRSEGHLRKDQRWRFEHLGKVDKISGNVIHSVRGRDGQIFTPFELEREKPLFESVPLVDIGPRFPFYDEYMSGAGGLTNFEDIRSGTQISLIGRFVPYFGDLATLQGLWTEVGNFTNHQELFGNLDWSSTRLTVCVALTNFIFNHGFWEERERFHDELSVPYVLLSKSFVSGYFPSRFPTWNGGCGADGQ